MAHRSPRSQPYEYKPLTGNDIRLVRLLPGRQPDGLYAEIIHRHLPPPITDGDQTRPSLTEIQRTLPEHWECSKTPEGKLVYFPRRVDGDGNHICRYDHPFPNQLSSDRFAAMQLDSDPSELNNTTNDDSDQAAEFEALSYTWGDAAARHVLYLTDAAVDGLHEPLSMTANLHDALQHLRYEKRSRLLWVDAICINQSDITERNEQVSRITTIFQSAGRVVAWLGKASLDSKVAMKTLQYIGKQIEITQDRHHLSPPDADERTWHRDDSQILYANGDWPALRSFVERPWFRRLWVVQEINLASSRAIMQCGHDTISYRDFRRAVASLYGQTGTPADLTVMLDNYYVLMYGLQNITTWDLMFVARYHDCVEPHDKIYALLGFFGPATRSVIWPSYEKSYAQVFKELFLAYSGIAGRLELLTYCAPDPESTLPSWVPDWRLPSSGIFVHSPPHSQAAGLSRAYFQENVTDGLEITGILVATVSFLFAELPDSSVSSAVTWLRSLVDDIGASDAYPAGTTGETMYMALLKVLSRNQTKERFADRYEHEYIERWLRGLQSTTDEILPGTSDLIPGQEIILSDALSLWKSCRWFRTTNGHIGFGPHELLPGDRICVLLGFYYPLIIRPTAHGNYSVIGTCYIHGFMDSEALLGSLPTGWTVAQWTVQGRFQPRFYHTGMRFNDAILDDPRLESLDTRWRRIERDLHVDDPEHVAYFENKSTGEVVNYDPRMSKEALERRGVKLQTITLV